MNQPLWASIAPEEVAIIVNAKSKDSLRIGKLYTRLRNVPTRNIIRVDVSMDDSISREQYEMLIAGPVRQAIVGLFNEGILIRCIVTTYGIPLRINPMRPLIYPEDKIMKHEGVINEKETEIARLKKKRSEEKKVVEKEKRNEGLIKVLNRDIKKLKKGIKELYRKFGRLKGLDTVAAVDSELAMLLVPNYQLAGWQHNPDFINNRKHNKNYFERLLMVSRLDAPTPELAEGLVRTAIEVERTGLSGKVYLDARGRTGKGAYGRYDENIRRTAKILQKGRLPVVLDNRQQLFGPGEAPSAALYCGWYSHKYYVDAFQWSKGAVGYHVASSEAVSLHNAKRKYWVKSMIEKGVIGSIGPVTEPYLSAFPLPSIFFPLLMSGEYTLVEVFAMTNPFLSWQMILVGDPLYNPFRTNPAFVIENPPHPPD